MFATRFSVRPLIGALCAAWLSLAGAPAGAELPALKSAVPKKAEAQAEKHADRTVEKATEKGGDAQAGAHAASQDPMDRLRERLAEKLGATKAPDHANPNVLRVVSRSGAAAESAHGKAGPSPAARLAAAHRASRPDPHAAAVDGHAAHAPHWDYQGEAGPEGWGALKPEFASCSTGRRQSPIDIRDGIKVQLEPVQFDYQASGFRVIDNGHTVQVNVGAGNSIEVMGRRYELLQFHFHRPSEERINGRQFDMVAHLVHKDLDGRLAVIAVLLDRGSIQPLVQTIWNNLPLEKGDEVAAKGAIDLNALLPAERSYYTYMGSLTTPPCSEGVLWMVMKNPVPISAEQVAIFARLYPMNARPIQSASGRLIKESN